MLFSKALLLSALAAFATAQSQVLYFTRVPNPVTDGEPQAITFATNDTASPVTITLKKGNPANLQTVSVLTTDATQGQYIWTPPLSLPNGVDYALEIKQASQVNYYGPFTVQGANYASISASQSANMTTTKTHGTGLSMGTGTTMHRNTTMVHPTVTKHTQQTHHTTGHTTKMMTTSGASFQGTQTGAAASSSTGGAPVDLGAGSSFALALGGVAAMVFLH